jgi:Tfp pilus assembly protein PilF
LKGSILVLLMGIPAVTFGATIPALLNNQQEVAKESGTLLYISSLANVGGFLLMALVLHQYLDYGVQLLAISALVTAALIAYQWQNLRLWTKNRLPLAATAVLIASTGIHHFKWDEDLLYLSYTSFHTAKDMEDDRKAFNFPEKFKGYQDVFSINWSGGNPYFFINGYISIPMNNPSEKVVGATGSMYSPNTKDALVLGLGSGGTASVVGMLFDHTDVVEINPVVRDNQFRMKRWNFDIESNPKVHIVVDDAIHYIQSESKTYDMILNTVTSPLYFSSSKLYTLDFFEKIKHRLQPDGVYVTWMDSRIGSQGARIVLTTLKQKFKHCSVIFIKSGYYLLIASDNPVRLQHPDLVDQKSVQLKNNLMENGIIPRQLAYNVLTSEVFTDKMTFTAPINTINRPVLEFEMASLKKKEFTDFQKQLFSTMSLDDVAQAVEPKLKYDPVEHISHVRMALKNSTVTSRFEQLGRVYVRNLDVRVEEEMLASYRTIAQTINTAEAHHQLGDQLRMRHRYDAALPEYQLALQLDPKHKDTLFNIAACLEYQGKSNEALDKFQQASEQFPEDMDALYRIARLRFKLNQLPEALSSIDRVLSRMVNEDNYSLKAEILQMMGRNDEAGKVYREMLQLNPDNPDAQYELGKSLAKW